MLSLNNIEVMYVKVFLALKGISVLVKDESIVTLLGANGAGKTTTLKAISGLLKSEEGDITSGNIEFNGYRIDNMNASKIAQLGVVQVMEGRKVLEHLTVEQNLLVGGHYIGKKMRNENLGLVYNYFPLLKKLNNQISGFLSGGEQQMLVLGRALMTNPKLMLLDEPSLGLSPILVNEIFSILKRINEDLKTSVLLVEQNAKKAISIASYGYVLENGRLVLEGSADELKNNEDIKEFYLGFSKAGGRKHFSDVKHYKRRKRWLG